MGIDDIVGLTVYYNEEGYDASPIRDQWCGLEGQYLLKEHHDRC